MVINGDLMVTDGDFMVVRWWFDGDWWWFHGASIAKATAAEGFTGGSLAFAADFLLTG